MGGRRYLIIGAGPAGLAAAAAIRRTDPIGRLTILSAESDRPYFRPLIPFVVSGKKTGDAITIAGRGPFPPEELDIRLNSRVVAIDPDRRIVQLADTAKLPYDRLLIASGGRPLVPAALAGCPGPGIFTLRTLADARAIAARLLTTRQAVLLGGGILCLKLAAALREKGIAVTIVECAATVLPRLLDADGAAIIADALSRIGVRVVTSRTIAAIRQDGDGVREVELDNGDVLPCQMVCIGIGVQPALDFLTPDLLTPAGGLAVNAFTESGIGGIYAAGDAAVSRDRCSGEMIAGGLWTTAVEMGRCAGFTMAGRRVAYEGGMAVMNAAQVGDTPFVAMGMVQGDPNRDLIYATRRGRTYHRLIFSGDGRILRGALFITDISRAGIYRQLLCGKQPLPRDRQALADHRLHYGHWLAR
ncbi:MAG: NAD(P)/FAD-dependent oxidoreductase [Thermodesulfobacteriota bacterium]